MVILYLRLGWILVPFSISYQKKTSTPPPQKLASLILDYPGSKNRNPVAAELQILGGLILEDIANLPDYEEDFVRETYCESGALSQYALVSKEILIIPLYKLSLLLQLKSQSS